MFDVYNVFHARPVQFVNSTFGPSFLRPTAILGGRLFKFGVGFDLSPVLTSVWVPT